MCDHDWELRHTLQYSWRFNVPKEVVTKRRFRSDLVTEESEFVGYYDSRHDYFYCRKCLDDKRKDYRSCHDGYTDHGFFLPFVETEYFSGLYPPPYAELITGSNTWGLQDFENVSRT